MTKKLILSFAFALIFSLLFACKNNSAALESNQTILQEAAESGLPQADEWGKKVAAAALSLTLDDVVYDPTYFSIKYPGGDVPKDKGVCTDVVIRTFRKMNIDLQKEVHEDMAAHFNIYPNKWGLKKTDKNIDHRRVPNLMVYFARKGTALPITQNGKDYLPGDIVTWVLSDGKVHIGMVSNVPARSKENYQIIHNIGRGQVLEDCLFNFKITGHYRYGDKK